MRRVLFLHTHRTAAAPDIAGQTQQILYGDHLHIFITSGFGGLLQVQLAADRDAEYVDAGPFAPGNQSFEHLFTGHTDGLGSVIAVQIFLIIFIKTFPAGNLCLLNQTDCVGFCCHNITNTYYTLSCQVPQEGIKFEKRVIL